MAEQTYIKIIDPVNYSKMVPLTMMDGCSSGIVELKKI